MSQIVISISEDELNELETERCVTWTLCEEDVVGILPERHGRLIDADELIDSHNAFMRDMKNNDEVCSCLKEVLDGTEIMLEMVDTAPTIIEADKAESEGKE